MKLIAIQKQSCLHCFSSPEPLCRVIYEDESGQVKWVGPLCQCCATLFVATLEQPMEVMT